MSTWRLLLNIWNCPYQNVKKIVDGLFPFFCGKRSSRSIPGIQSLLWLKAPGLHDYIYTSAGMSDQTLNRMFTSTSVLKTMVVSWFLYTSLVRVLGKKHLPAWLLKCAKLAKLAVAVDWGAGAANMSAPRSLKRSNCFFSCCCPWERPTTGDCRPHN